MTINLDLTGEEAARGQVGQLLAAADLPGVAVPMGTHDLLRLLDELAYDLDEAGLRRLIDAGRAGTPRRVAGKWLWSAGDILAVVGACEGLRLWRWPSKRHLHKFTEHERLLAQARAEGALDSVVEACSQHSIRELLLLLASCDSRTVRESIRPLLQARLEARGIGPHE